MSAKGTILIVEDNEQNTEMVKELLEEIGFQTLTAEDADAGIRLARQKHPDLILMDIYMPGKNGYEASQTLKSNPETRDIPIVAFTALAMEKDRQRAETAGCIGIISKPIDVDTFAFIVSSFLADSQNNPGTLMTKRAVTLPALLDADKEFLLKLSHDLQAPIRKINQFSSWLKKAADEKLSAEDQESLKGIDRATQQMQDVLKKALAECHSRKA